MAHTNVQMVMGNLTTGEENPTLYVDRVNGKVGVSRVPDSVDNSNVFQVNGDMQVVDGTVSATNFVGSGIGITGLYDSKWLEYSGDTSKIYYNGGNVGIGVDNPGAKLEVNGDIYATGDVTASSDRRLKTDIKRIENALDKVCAIGGYTYMMNDKPSTGLIAQEVLEVLPEVIHGSEETSYSLAYGNVIGLLVEAIKELKEKIG